MPHDIPFNVAVVMILAALGIGIALGYVLRGCRWRPSTSNPKSGKRELVTPEQLRGVELPPEYIALLQNHGVTVYSDGSQSYVWLLSDQSPEGRMLPYFSGYFDTFSGWGEVGNGWETRCLLSPATSPCRPRTEDLKVGSLA